MRLLVLLVVLPAMACATDDLEPYRFEATVDPGTSTVLIDGSSDLSPIQASYPTFEAAAAAIHIPVLITSSTSNQTEITPGYCAETASRLGITLGDMKAEVVTLVVTSGLLLHASEATCIGTDGGFTQTP